MLSRLRNTAPWLALLASAALLLAPDIALAHDDDAYYHGRSDLADQSRWMAQVPDATAIRAMSIPGTHNSASRHWGDAVATQTLTVSQQLKAGVRFLDIRLRHINNALAVHHGPFYQQAMFGEVLKEVRTFLASNPSETVLMRVKEEFMASRNTRAYEETVRSYINGNPGLFALPNTADPTLGALRGKVLMLTDFPVKDANAFGARYRSVFPHRQDAWMVSTNWDLHWKWEQIKNNLGSAWADRTKGHLNFLSATGGSFPYFIASGHVSPATDAPRLVTGYTTPGWSHVYPDFPRLGCFIGICTIAFEGTNTLTKNLIRSRKPTYVGVVVADFPGAGLIRSIIDVNKHLSPAMIVNETKNQCMDIYGGLGAGRALYAWSCHGGANQMFRFDGDRIRVGTLCLAVDGRSRHKARVMASPCDGGQGQKWRMNPNRTIQSLLKGPARCLDVAFEDGGAISLWACTPASSDQRFFAL